MFVYQLLPIEVDDYKKLIDGNRAYIDKTLLVKEFWQDGAEVILAPRPRRFGKTLNLSMLKYFFEKMNQDTSYLFEKMDIWQHSEFRALQGQFPVIFLNFKDIKVDSWELAYAKLAGLISDECKRLLNCISVEKMGSIDGAIFERLVSKQASEQELMDSLQFLTRMLCQQLGKKVIILIDEYDAPIIHAYLNNYYLQMTKFMSNLLSKVFKTNSSLEKGFLTGITRVAKEGIFSGLNNLAVRTVLTNKYSDKFGFTQEEVDRLLVSYGLSDRKDEIKKWYDGYVFGNTNVYNPWSVVSCIDEEGALRTYWANTSNNDLIRDLIASASRAIKDDIELLLQGKVLEDKEVDDSVPLRDIQNNTQGFWGLFLSTGYITAISQVFKNNRYYYTLALPNTEITLLYQELVARAIDRALVSGKISELFMALMTGDCYQLTILLQEFIIQSCSVYDFPKDDSERSIHMLVLGLLAGLSNRYVIKSNRESGHGRYDIVLAPRTPQDPGIVIEFKKAKNEDEVALKVSAQEALEQIKNKSYVTDIRSSGYSGPIFCYGIVVFRKHVVVNMEIVEGGK